MKTTPYKEITKQTAQDEILQSLSDTIKSNWQYCKEEHL